MPCFFPQMDFGCLVNEIGKNLFPIQLLCTGSFIVFLKHWDKLFRKFPGKVHRAIHDPGIRASDLNFGNRPFFIGSQTPFRSSSFLIYRAVPGTTFIHVKHIAAQPVVRREKIRISAFQIITGVIYGGERVFAAVFRIIN